MKNIKAQLFILFFGLTFSLFASNFDSINEKTKEMEKQTGFFSFYWDNNSGKVWLEIDKLDEEFLYQVSLPRGIGSNDIGLDRGQLGSTRVVHFEKHGNKILLVQDNLDYRAITDNEEERKAVEESFAKSVLFGFEIAAEENGNYLVDGTSFYLQDAHNVSGILADMGQGNYALDNSKSVLFLENTKNFPLNTEVEVLLTFAGSNPGNYVRSVVPTPALITVHQRHSFVQLPDDGYELRKDDVRSGYYGISYYDYAAPLEEPLEKRFISRHRLQKKNPSAEVSEAVEPIIYYVDSGAPEPVKSALIEGASWWNQAFEAAGYLNAFQVKELPPGADPMDVRYNTIQWVHRSTRGWSYGWGVIDPRTGEIIKGHVTLGSLRIRQDYLLAEGLLSPYKNENSESDEMREMALARIRQLSAHEVGHTLGIRHNFTASTYGRASVMDYPHPYVKLNEDGSIDLSEAYDDKIGEWDKTAIAYGYQDFGDDINEDEALNEILNESIEKGQIYISDTDARPAGGLHPKAHLWDNGESAVDELNRILKVRETALNNFSDAALKFGRPLAELEEVFVPVYLMHRYQTEAAVKVLGGADYSFKVRGDSQTLIKIVDAEDQTKALDALIKTIDAKNLIVPERILSLLVPQPEGYRKTRENFKSYTGLSFDPVAAAETAANHTVKLILNPQRAARLIEHNARGEKYPSLGFVIDELIKNTFEKNYEEEYQSEINRAVSNVVLNQLFKLAGDKSTLSQVNAIALQKLRELKSVLVNSAQTVNNEKQIAHFNYIVEQINRFTDDPGEYKFDEPLAIPAGSPIGCGM